MLQKGLQVLRGDPADSDDADANGSW